MKIKMTVVALMLAVTPQIRATIHRAFRSDDFEIVWTASPADGVAASAIHRPDLVLLELNKPLRKGADVFAKLRTVNPNTPFVLLEGNGAKANGGGDITGAGVAVLRKPLSAAKLAETANALLKGSSTKKVSGGNEPGEAIRNSERFREMLLARYNAPFVFAPSYRHWGINE
jgi:DNA-binding response OmpR family regulator